MVRIGRIILRKWESGRKRGLEVRILFALSSLHCGGIEKSALTLLHKLVERGDDVTLALAKKEGEFLPYVPNAVHVMEIPYSRLVREEMRIGRKMLLIRLVARLRLISAINLICFSSRLALLKADHRALAIAKRFCASLLPDETIYDQALCFSEFTELVYVAKCVKAKEKAVWLHTEQGNGFSDVRVYERYLAKMNIIYCVSDALIDQVKVTLPEFSGKVRRYHHYIDCNLVNRLAEESHVDWPGENGVFRILSVGRLARQKGFDLIPSIICRLNAKGVRVSWLVLGEGSERSALEKLSCDEGVSDRLHFLGVKVNPYPYYKACDLYVQPSRYEGYCLTLAEARALGKAFVATDFCGAREQLDEGGDGVIVPCESGRIEAAILAKIREHRKGAE